MRQATELLTPESLLIPRDRKENFWYVRGDPDTAFIFLHGINSSSRACWLYEDTTGSRKVFWPDLVRNDWRFRDASIYLAGYYTAPEAGDYGIGDCAREVFDALKTPHADGSPPALDASRIVFVCHSTGGIVARQLLDTEREAFRDKTVGLALIASPSLGSRWANLFGLLFWYYNQHLGLRLRRNDPELVSLHERFKNVVRQHKIPRLFGKEACENKMILRDRLPRLLRVVLPPRLTIVSRLSAGQYFDSVKVLADTDHFSCVKPPSVDHPGHEFLATFAVEFHEYAERVDFAAQLQTDMPRSDTTDSATDAQRPVPSAASAGDALRRSADEQSRANQIIADYVQQFVGREAEIDKVLSLLHTAKPGYLHVRGDAGSGKSALIATCVDRIRRDPPAGVAPILVHYFIRQGQTDTVRLLEALCDELARALRERVNVATELEPLVSQFRDLWNRVQSGSGPGRPLLLCLDGLDELTDQQEERRQGALADPEERRQGVPADQEERRQGVPADQVLADLLPSSLAEHVHVVVTSRPSIRLTSVVPPTGHVARWAEIVDLPPFTDAEVEQLLSQMSSDAPRAARLAPRVTSITRGLPLTTYLLCREIVDDGEQALSSERLSRALTDYLRDDAKRLVNAAISDIDRRAVALLAVAREGLTFRDLASVLRVDERAATAALARVKRYLHLDRPAFLHVELKSAIAAALTDTEKQSAGKSLSRWVRSLGGATDPAPLSRYILTHFVDQAIEEHAEIGAFRPVFESLWSSAHQQQRLSYGGYANDLTKIRDYAAAIPDWPTFIEASYRLALLRAAATALPLSVVGLLGRVDRFETAESYARLDTDAAGRCWAMLELAELRIDAGDGAAGRDRLAQVERELSRVDDATARLALLAALAARYERLGNLAKARELARHCWTTVQSIDDTLQQSRAIPRAVDALLETGLCVEAIDGALAHRDDWDRGKELARIAVRVVRAGSLDLLEGAVSRLTDTTWRGIAIKDTVRALAAEGLIVDARRVAAVSPEPVEHLAPLCGGLAQAGRIDECIATFREIAEGPPREPPPGGRFSRWRRRTAAAPPAAVPRAIYASLWQRWAVEEILRGSAGDLPPAQVAALVTCFESALLHGADARNAKALAQVVEWAERRRSPSARGLAERLARAVRSHPDHEQAESCLYAARALRAVHAWPETIAVLQPVLEGVLPASEDVRNQARWRASQAYARGGTFDEAFRIADETQSVAWRALALGAIATVLCERGETERTRDTAERALRLAADVTPDRDRKAVLEALAEDYADAGGVDEALAAAGALSGARDKTIAAVARRLFARGDITGAEQAARGIGDYKARSSCFVGLAGHALANGRYDRALEMVARIEAPLDQADRLVSCARIILARVTPFEKRTWSERLTGATRRLEGFARLYALGAIGQIELEQGDRERARTIADEALRSAHDRDGVTADTFAGIARALVGASAPTQALGIITATRLETSDAASAAGLLAQVGEWDRAGALVDRVDGLSRVDLLAELADRAIDAGQESLARTFEARLRTQVDGLPANVAPLGQVALAGVIFRRGDRTEARQIAEGAFATMVASGSATGLRSVSNRLVRAGQADLAVRAIGSEDAHYQALQEADVAGQLADFGDTQAARGTALRILRTPVSGGRDGFWESWIYSYAVSALAKAGDLEAALQHVAQISSAVQRAGELIRIADAFADRADPGRAHDAATKALSVLDDDAATESSPRRAQIATVFCRIGRTDECQALIVRALRAAQDEKVDTFLRTLVAACPALITLAGPDSVAQVVLRLAQAVPLQQPAAAAVVRV